MTFICVDSNVLLRIAGQINRILTFGDPASTDSSTIATAHRSKLEKKKRTAPDSYKRFLGRNERGPMVKLTLQAVLGCHSIPTKYPPKMCRQVKLLEKAETNSMLQSPSSEANPSSASQKILRILWNTKVRYGIHKSPPPAPILSQNDPVHAPPSHLSKIHFNIMRSSTPGSFKWSPSLRFPHSNHVRTSPLPHTCHVSCPSQSR